MPKAYAIQKQKVVSETLDGETILINLETGTYYSMNEAGTAVWEAISQRLPIDVVNPAIASFVASLEREQLIGETEPAAGAVAASVSGTPAFEIYTDMQEMILADPIHDVEAAGWPLVKKDTQ